MHSAAALPTACAAEDSVAWTRVELKATCDALKMRPARNRFLMFRL
jgi:hypothetical protein